MLLVERGFSANACDDSQFSALEAAAVHHHENVVIFLLRNGARPNSSTIQATRQINHARIRGLLNGTLPLPTRHETSGEIPLRNILIDRASAEGALAFIATISSRRRITANSNPGGVPPQCSICQDLHFRRGAPKDVEVMHLIPSNKLARGAESGCPGCIMIRQCLTRLAADYGESLAAWRTADMNITLLSMVRGGPLYIVPGPVNADQPTVRAEIYSHPGMSQFFLYFSGR